MEIIVNDGCGGIVSEDLQQAESGFTLFDLLAAICVFSILSLLAVPEVENLWTSMAKNNAVQLLDFDIRRARAETLSEGTRGILIVSPDGSEYSFGFDYFPYNNNKVPDKIIFSRKLPKNIYLSIISEGAFFFSPDGFSVTAQGSSVAKKFSLQYKNDPILSGVMYASGGVVYDSL